MKIKTSTSFTDLFEHEYRGVLGKMEDLRGAINNLQYEGKIFFGKNTKTIEKTVKFLEKKLVKHIDLDEDVIFPFLQIHIPRLETMLFFLRAERNEFKLSLENFQFLFKQLKEEKNGLRQQKIIDQLKEKAVYIIALMRNHIQIEIESVYKSLDQQLHEDEKKALIKKCVKHQVKSALK